MNNRPQKFSTEHTLNDSSIFTWEAVLPLVLEEFKKGKTIAIANGNFVLLHTGHSLLFEGSRREGAVRRSDKDENGIIVLAIVNATHQTRLKDPIKASLETDAERARKVYDNRHIDFVVISEAPKGDYTMLTDFQRLIDAGVKGQQLINVKGYDYRAFDLPPEAELVTRNGGQVIILDNYHGITSSSVLEALKKALVGKTV